MGLDQFWKTETTEELHYHRKVPALEGWMAAKYAAQGGQGTFNVERVYITDELLNELESAIDNKTLDTTVKGFFWGEHYPEDIADIKEAIAKARAAIADGKTVYYTSWW